MMRRKRLLVALGVALALAAAVYVFAGRLLASDAARGALERQLSRHLGQPVRIGAASMTFFPRVAVRLRAVSIGAPVAVELGEVRLLTGLRPLFSRRIEDAEIVIADSRIALPIPFALAGAAGTEPGATDSTPALAVASIRLIALRDVTLTAGRRSVVIDADSSLAGDRLDISRVTARAGTTRLEARGALTSLARFEGSLDATADPLDLDELTAIGAALSGSGAQDAGKASTAQSSAMQVRLTVRLAAPSGRFAEQTFTNLSTTLAVVPGTLTLDPFSVGAFGGTFRGRLVVATARAAPQSRLTGRVDDLDVAALMTAAGSPGGVTGRLGGSIALTGEGTESQALMRTARGTITAAITDGAIPGLDMVRTIVLAFGKPAGAPAEGSGSSFSRLGGTFALAGGTLSSDDVSMASRDFDMVGRGSVQLSTSTVSARADVILSRDLTAQAGTDLRRYAQEDGRVIVPATIGGTLQRPAVALDIAAATRRALGNELRRRAKSLLEGLFKKKER